MLKKKCHRGQGGASLRSWASRVSRIGLHLSIILHENVVNDAVLGMHSPACCAWDKIDSDSFSSRRMQSRPMRGMA